MPGWITINTDAGFYQWSGLGSYAYWIRYGNGQLLTGSGVFKEKCKTSSEAEERAILNALHVVRKSVPKGIIKIIFNRDNTNVSANPTHKYGKSIYDVLVEMHDNYIVSIGGSVPFQKFFEFRHVKAHNISDNKRTWVNNRLDELCTLALREETKRRQEENKKKRAKAKKKHFNGHRK